MRSVFNDIQRLAVNNDVLLLSSTGEVLYGKLPQSFPGEEQLKLACRHFFSTLEEPESGQFHFDNGLCYMVRTRLGYLVVGLKDPVSLGEVKAICSDVQRASADPLVRKKTLLNLLAEADFRFKPQIVEEMAALADSEIAHHLISVLGNYGRIPEDVRTRLLLAACRILGDCKTRTAVGPLQVFLEMYAGDDAVDSAEVEQAARVSLQQLQFDRDSAEEGVQNTRGKNAVKGDGTSSPSGVKQDSSATSPQPAASPAKQEKAGATATSHGSKVEMQVKQLLQQGRKQEAAAIIMKHIEVAARQRKFARAEKLRDRLIDIDSMMLSDIIRAAEIIEAEKTASIDVNHMATWRSLVETLTQEEFSSLYHAMDLKRCVNSEMVVEQGQKPRLVFVNDGELRVVTNVSGREVYLKSVERGEVLGADCFFESSVWTVSARSNGAEIFTLRRADLDQLSENYPALESKLIDFCAQFSSPNVLFQKTRRSRRKFERKSISGRTAFRLLDRNGGYAGEKIKGELFDISRGGTSFCVRISKKKNAGRLFGRKIEVYVPYMADGKIYEGKYVGSIVAVRGHHVVSNEYSVHVQFDNTLSAELVQQAVQLIQRSV